MQTSEVKYKVFTSLSEAEIERSNRNTYNSAFRRNKMAEMGEKEREEDEDSTWTGWLKKHIQSYVREPDPEKISDKILAKTISNRAEEDIYCLVSCSNNYKFILVGDGHGYPHRMEQGHICHTVCYGHKNFKPLHEVLIPLIEGKFGMDEPNIGKIVQAIEKEVKKYDKDLYEHGCKEGTGHKGGMCFTALIVCPSNYILTINLGDCRLTIYDEPTADIIHQSFDHKPSDPNEEQRIKESGGIVLMGRVGGNLAVSRSLGDWDFKSCGFKKLKGDLVSAIPTVNMFKIGENISGCSCLMSSDGAYHYSGMESGMVIDKLIQIKGEIGKEGLLRKLIFHYRSKSDDDMTFVYIEKLKDLLF